MAISKIKKQQIIADLTQKINSMTIPVLYRELVKLDEDRKQVNVNQLLPEKFRLLVAYEMTTRKLTTEIWGRNVSIEKHLLDALSPKQLIYIGRKQSAMQVAWGEWKNLRDECLQKPFSLCEQLSSYFLACEPKRAAKIVSFFVKSTKGVSAPAIEEERNLFRYKEGKQFPFETISLFSSMHPKILFPAINTLSTALLNKVWWLCNKMQGDSDSIENVFAHSYAGRSKAYIDQDVVKGIVSSSYLLKNKPLYMLLKRCKDDTQELITEALGKERLVEMKKECYSFAGICISSSITLRDDKIPNEFVLQQIASGAKSTKSLKPEKVLELLGEVAA